MKRIIIKTLERNKEIKEERCWWPIDQRQVLIVIPNLWFMNRYCTCTQVVFIATTSAAAPPPVNFTCPTNTNSFKPCGCKPWNSLRGVELDCRSRGLNDVKIIQVLNNFKPEKGSPLVSLNANSNSLTKVPAEISKFPSLSFISFYVNKIKSLPFNAFNLPDVKNISIILADNEIHSVAPGAFNFPSATDMTVSLSSNYLKSFSASAFKGESITAIMNTAPFNLLWSCNRY